MNRDGIFKLIKELRAVAPSDGDVATPLWLSDEIESKIRARFLIGAAVAVALFSTWAGFTEIDSVTRSTGTVVPLKENQVIQHLEGGIVSEILVKEGDKVAQGQILLRVYDSQSQATLQQNLIQLAARRAALARIEAELASANEVQFPPDLQESSLKASEREFFLQRRRDHQEQLLVLSDKVRQNEISLAGLKARQVNLTRERELTGERVESLQKLNAMGAVSKNELLQGMAALQQLQTKIIDLDHDIPQTEAALSEATRQRNATELKFRSESAEERVKVLVEITQLQETIAGMRDRAVRTEIRAPAAGTVNKRYVVTVGGVIAPGAPIMEIVPDSETIAIEAQLSPQDRADVWPGTKAIVKITAYDYSVYGGLEAQVVDISPDIIREKDAQPYFRVRLNADNRLGNRYPIIPGMMANVDMLTKRYSVLQYIMAPVARVQDMAFRR